MSISEAGLVKIDPEQEIKETEMFIGVKVGTQTIKTEKFKMEVFDCNNHLVFASKSDHQINAAENKVFPALTSNDRPEDCVVSAYDATGLNEVITMEKETGIVTINTAKEMEKTEVQISTTVGTQTISTPKLQFEVYDCSTAMVFADSPRYQVNSKVNTWNIFGSNSRPKSCGTYTMTFVENPSPNSIKKGKQRGQIVLDVSKEMVKTSLKVEINVGIQKLTHTFVDMEVFDCIKVLEFPKLDLKKGYRYQIEKKNTRLFSLDGGFKSGSDDCVISSYSLTNKAKGISMDTSSGLIRFGYQKNIPKTTT